MTKGGVAYAKYIGVIVGKGCRITTRNFGSEPFLVKLGDKVLIGSGVKFVTHDASASMVSDEKGRRHIFHGIDVGNNVFIGINCILLPGTNNMWTSFID
jgi:acetyltransferase-like isoleucine patch superfamily enzyme